MRHTVKFLSLLSALVLAGCDVLFPTPPITPLPPSDTPAPVSDTATSAPTPVYDAAVIQTGTALALGIVSTPLPSDTPSPVVENFSTAGPVETATPILLSDVPTQDPNLPPGCMAVHVVQAGEWLELIARNYNVSSSDLALANGLADPESLAVGQTLCIPLPGAVIVPPGPTPVPTFTPPPGDGLAILSFAASPNPVERGEVLRLNWTVRGTTAVRLWRLIFDSKTNQWYRPPTPAYTGTGDAEMTIPIPLDERRGMLFELEVEDADGQTLSVMSQPVSLVCHPPFYASVAGCLSAPKTVEGEFQAFEHGAILWRSDTGEVIVLPLRTDTYHPWSLQLPTGETVTPGAPPEGLFAPGAHFAEVWAARATIAPDDPTRFADVLGWATSPPERYALTIQAQLDPRYSMFDSVFVNWPDGRVAQLYTGGGLPRLGLSGPAWGFLNL